MKADLLTPEEELAFETYLSFHTNKVSRLKNKTATIGSVMSIAAKVIPKLYRYLLEGSKLPKINLEDLVRRGRTLIPTLASPLQLTFEVIKTCNLSCLHCFQQALKKQREKPELDDLTYLDYMSKALKSFPYSSVGLLGGEPFLAGERLDQILSLDELQKRPIILTTNGTINICKLAETRQEYQGILTALCDPDININVYFSFEGIDSHNKIRDPENYYSGRDDQGFFGYELNNVVSLMNRGANVAISTTINAININEIEEMVDVFVNRGIKKIYVDPITPFYGINKKLILPPELRDQAAEILERLALKYPDIIKMTPEVAKLYRTEFLDEVIGDQVYGENGKNLGGEKCPFAKGAILSFDYRMQPVTPCLMGQGVICNGNYQGKDIGCGCIFPFIYYSLIQGDLETLIWAYKTFVRDDLKLYQTRRNEKV